MTLAELLSGAGYVLDTPGALTRGLLAGAPGSRKSGREMLEAWGALGSNKEGLDMGDVAGFLAEIVADPTNLIPFGAIAKAAKAGKLAKAFNSGVDDMLKAGAMPAERAATTMIRNQMDEPMRVLHGTPYVFDLKPDFNKFDPNGLIGRGYYTTDDLNFNPAVTNQDVQMGRVTGGELTPAGEVIRGYVNKGEQYAPKVYGGAGLDDASLFGAAHNLFDFKQALSDELETFLNHPGSLHGMDPEDAGAVSDLMRDLRESFTHGKESLQDGPPSVETLSALWSRVEDDLAFLEDVGLRELASKPMTDYDAWAIPQILRQAEGTTPYNVRMHHIYSEKPFRVNHPNTVDPVMVDTQEFLPYLNKESIARSYVPPGLAHSRAARATVADLAGMLGTANSKFRNPFGQDILKQYGGESVGSLRRWINGISSEPRQANYFNDLRDSVLDAMQQNRKMIFFDPQTGLPSLRNAKLADLMNARKAVDKLTYQQMVDVSDPLLALTNARYQRIANNVDNVSQQAIPKQLPAWDLWHAIDRNAPASKALADRLGFGGRGGNLQDAINASEGLPRARKLERNDVLKELGYDAITHTGGSTEPMGIWHNVTIGLDPDKIYGPWIAPNKKPIPSLMPSNSLMQRVAMANAAGRAGGLASQY